MSFRREKVDFANFPETKSIVMQIEYSGTVSGPQDMALLLGDAWHQYCVENGIDPIHEFQLIMSVKGKP